MGLTREDTGAKLMLMVANHGIPSGALVASAQKVETSRDEAILATVRVSRTLGLLPVRPGNR